MNRAEKQKHKEFLENVFQENETVIVCRNHGIDVQKMEGFRIEGRKSEVGVKVVKNSIARLVTKEKFDADDFFQGPCLLLYSKDIVAPAKLAVEFNKAVQNLEIVGGFSVDQKLDSDSVNRLAKMPSLEESRAMLAGVINQPASLLARLIQEPSASVARVIGKKFEVN